MTPKDDLFQLIKSLSKSEKGYFKKFASKYSAKEKNISLRLFDVIDSFKIYNEKNILKKFEGQKISLKLSSYKNYLFNQILKALTSYHSEKSDVIKLNNLLTELGILFEKGLYKQYKNVLKRAINIAASRDLKYYLALLYSKELKYLVTDYYSALSEIKYEELKNKISTNFEYIKLDEEYQVLYYELFILLKNISYIRTKSDLEKLDKFMSNVLLTDFNNAKSFNSKFHFFSIHGHYCRVTNNIENWYKYRKDLLDLVSEDPEYINQYPINYISALNNFLNAAIHAQKHNEFITNLEKLKTFSKRFEGKKEYTDTAMRIFLLSADLELSYYINICRYEKIREVSKRIEGGFEEFSEKLIENRKISVYNQLSYGFFINKDYDKAIFYINKIINAINIKVDPDQHSLARVRNLILQFEAGNYDLLEYTVKSTKRFLTVRNRLYKFEKLIVDFVVKAANNPEEDKLKNLYQNLYMQMLIVSNDPFEKKALEMFDIISWIESKIQKKEFAEILKEKGKKHMLSPII